MREELFVPFDPDGSTCGCGPAGARCEEGKRLEEIISARYRNCAGIYNQRESRRLNALWREAIADYEQHCKQNHRD